MSQKGAEIGGRVPGWMVALRVHKLVALLIKGFRVSLIDGLKMDVRNTNVVVKLGVTYRKSAARKAASKNSCDSQNQKRL